MKFFQVGARVFEKVHYVDMENVQFKTFGANDHMLERLAYGRINAYKYYQYPADVRIYASEEI